VFPRLAVRQWVLSVPKRLRYFLQRDKDALNTALRVFCRVVLRTLQAHCPGAVQRDPATLHLGAVAFIHRFGSSLNTHVHFHVCVVDGVFESVSGPRPQPRGDADAAAKAKPTPTPQSVIFHGVAGLDEIAIAQVQADVRKRILRAFVARGLIEACDAKDMAGYAHGGGFSVDAGVCITAADRAGLERLLRYCARPPLAMDRLRQRGAQLVYHCPKPQSGGKREDLVLTPLELIDRIAALVPPPRTHRHRYFGVLAPNSPLRAAVTAMAQVATPITSPAPEAAATDASSDAVSGNGAAGAGAGETGVPAKPPQPEPKPKPRSPAHYLWAALIARIYEVFPLVCPVCAGQMRIIAFITQGAEVRKILEHIGVDAQPPRITPARGPPLWDACDAQDMGEGVECEPDWDLAAQAAPDYQVDQRTG
ncbi:MAG: transposase, partial [Polaromonas sp.]